MKINDASSKNLPFYLIVIGLFLIIISPSLLSQGMFMDGLIYSTIAKNLSDGIGSFWHPYFTATWFADFHEHPPLAIGIQSIFFSIFGESRFIDKLYSFLTFIIVGYIIVKIWKELGFKNGWFPLLFWISIPLVSWSCTNNLLENTMSIFTSLSVLFYLLSEGKKRIFFLILAGLMLSLGFLSKGFVSFFPWTFPFLHWLFLRKKSIKTMFLESTILLFSTLLPLLILIVVFPSIKTSLTDYIDIQVIKSLKSIITVDSRVFIIKKLFTELIPALGICILLIIWFINRKGSLEILKTNNKVALMFFLFGLTGVLPIMISMKQSGFYILATFPFFAISIAILLNPLLDHILGKINFQSQNYTVFKLLGIAILFIGIFLSLFFSKNFDRDKNKITDANLILKELPKGSIINVAPKMWDDWSLRGYYGRFKNVSLDPNLLTKRQYLLVQKGNYADSIIKDYQKINTQTTEYYLFKRIN